MSPLGAKMTIELIALLPSTCLRGGPWIQQPPSSPLAGMSQISIVIMIKVSSSIWAGWKVTDF